MFEVRVTLLVIPLCTFLFASDASSDASIQRDVYAPFRMEVPDTIGGYSVLAVLSADNYLCMKPGEKRLLLQAREPIIGNAVPMFSKQQMGKNLETSGLAEYAEWGWEVVGPAITRQEVVRTLDASYRLLKEHGCIRLRRLPMNERQSSLTWRRN